MMLGVLVGVIWSIAPGARIVELSHSIARHDVLEAALMLERCTPYFPRDTIHLVVVDPGVGTARRGLAARLGAQWFVGPDNGLITQMHAGAVRSGEPVEIVNLNQPTYWNPEVSAIFHGRDIFAPIAGHLAAGVSIRNLGNSIADPVLLDIPLPSKTETGWMGQVMHVDAFGNLSTNLERLNLQWTGAASTPGRIEVRVLGVRLSGLVRAFGDGKSGELAALIDSSDKLCICVVNGDAARRLGARVGDPVEVILD